MPDFTHYISKCLANILHTAILLSDLMFIVVTRPTTDTV